MRAVSVVQGKNDEEYVGIIIINYEKGYLSTYLLNNISVLVISIVVYYIFHHFIHPS